MWEINNSFQIFGFITASVLGGVYCVVYDFLRAIRKVGINSYFAVFFQDLFYFIIISPITFCFLLALTNGELRAYFFIGLVLGFTIIRISVSRVVLKVFIFLISHLIDFINLLNVFFNLIFEKIRLLYEFFKKISLKVKFVSKNS